MARGTDSAAPAAAGEAGRAVPETWGGCAHIAGTAEDQLPSTPSQAAEPPRRRAAENRRAVEP
ncbi:hypothetical protein ACFYZ2_02230 [Streptomyces sviceus]|uniref:hypothetical protein n=1 Tax=Streptomyces sviceus TaxID=285530 RepID=UPI0036A572AA